MAFVPPLDLTALFEVIWNCLGLYLDLEPAALHSPTVYTLCGLHRHTLYI